jgi:hypothetical protein
MLQQKKPCGSYIMYDCILANPTLYDHSIFGILMLPPLPMQDSARLAISGKRLARARRTLEQAYGHGLQRLRKMQAGLSVESATFLRLSILEGMLARYTGDIAVAARAARAAQSHLKQLTVSDTALAALVGMGFESRTSARALRFCEGDVVQATNFCLEQRATRAAQGVREARARELLQEQRGMGRTHDGGWIDVDCLQHLEELGYPLLLAAEALRCATSTA